MKSLHRLLVIPAALVAFGCKGNDSKAVDSALNSDLSMASQAHPAIVPDSIATTERTRSNSYTATPAPVAAPAAHVRERTVVHDVYRDRGSQSSASSSGGSYTPAPPPAPTYHVDKHPQRDAAIGAGAGAILGAATSRNKVKGGIIGAAAGGILGAVIGNNVDKRKVPNP